jgi:hypothetical protein
MPLDRASLARLDPKTAALNEFSRKVSCLLFNSHGGIDRDEGRQRAIARWPELARRAGLTRAEAPEDLTEDSPADSDAPTCSRCGAALEDDAKFCSECGLPVDGPDDDEDDGKDDEDEKERKEMEAPTTASERKLNELARARAARDRVTFAEAYTAVLKENPRLYVGYLVEKRQATFGG